MNTDERIKQLEEEVQALKQMLTLQGMPYELREIIRGEVIKGEDSLITKTQVYTDSRGDTVTGPKAYLGILVFEWDGKEYPVPYLSKS